MDYPGMATMANELSDTNSTDYSPTRLLPFFNAVKDDLWSYIITSIKGKYNWDIWTVDNTVVNQSEYVIPAAASDTEWNLKISWIGLCYDGDTYSDWTKKFIPAREVNPEWLKEHWNYYINNQSVNDPIYYIADKSIFIAPTFKAIRADCIELKWIKSIVDYTITTAEAGIWLPSYLHIDVVKGVLPFIHRSQWNKKDAQFEEATYNTARDLAAAKFANRNIAPHYMKFEDEVYDDSYTITIN